MLNLPYEADFECPKGHKFTNRVQGPMSSDDIVRCPMCLEEFLKKNVLDATQVSDTRQTRTNLQNLQC